MIGRLPAEKLLVTPHDENKNDYESATKSAIVSMKSHAKRLDARWENNIYRVG